MTTVPPTSPEILPPGHRLNPRRAEGNQNISDEQLNQLATVLDDVFQVPGTNIRFGLDAVLGLIPGVGDVLSGILSFIIVFAAWQRGLPRVTIARMMANITIDTLVGSMPILGDAFDTVWKSNRMNYNLLVQASQNPPRKQALQDWVFLLLMILLAAALIAVPAMLLIWLFRMARAHGGL